MSTTQSGPIRGRFEALTNRLTQTVETVTRTSRINVATSGVDDLQPPEDIDEYHQLYREIAIVRANLNQFAADVVEPGVRIEADDDATQAYFEGGDEAPSETPDGGFLNQCAVVAGEKHKPFYPYLKSSIVQRRTRGTVLHEYMKADVEDPASIISGFKHIRPETVSARTYENTNILLDPDDTETADASEITQRGEAAAYVQFDRKSILGRRLGGFENRTTIYLSQNDVLKQVFNPDIGGDDATEEGVFGTSVMEAVAQDCEEYQQIKRDRARAIKNKAWGIWKAQFSEEFLESEMANEVIFQEWPEEDQYDWLDKVGEIGPGDIIGHDGTIEFDKFEGGVPDLGDTLQHYVDDILAPLPAPKYATAHGETITQHVTEEQGENYNRTVKEEREYQERSWTEAFREVARRHPDLDPSGLKVKLEPDEDESPVMSLDDETVSRMKEYAEAVDIIENSVSLSQEEKRELILQLPGTPEIGSLEEEPLDEDDEQVQAQFG